MSQVKTGNQVNTSPSDIAEALNYYFTNIGQSLAQEIPSFPRNSWFNIDRGLLSGVIFIDLKKAAV